MIDFPLVTVTEGKTPILVPDVEVFRKSPVSFPPSDAPVFYNKKMEINRDYALAVIRIYLRNRSEVEQPFFCEPLAGSGIRSVRIANEIENIKTVINDINPIAVQLIEKNIVNLSLKDKAIITNDDANKILLHFSALGEKFDIIDIDPFGSPAPFTDSACQAVKNNGLLAITSTDMATMCGVYQKACIRKYASQPIHTSIGHEVAVRMQIGFIATLLARYEKGIVPLFAHSTDHFIRTYSLAIKGITIAKEAMDNLGFVTQCPNCLFIEYAKGIVNYLPQLCPQCGEKRLFGGPIWLGKIFDEQFVNHLKKEIEDSPFLYGTNKKMLKMLSLIQQEVEAEKHDDALFFFDIHELSDKLSVPTPKFETLITKLQEKGYVAYRTHFRLTAVKTNTPIKELKETILEVLKES
ncbi:MAG: tRNA (guanine(10)-N(2))-dimethyltransferase [Candidatus Thorarchaeota archaeon]